MVSNQNEKYLLRFISSSSLSKNKDNDLLEVIYNFGIKLNFKNSNSVYQIIDELNYSNCYKTSRVK